jgi:hypothetical protein
LIRSQSPGVDVREDEVLRWDRRSGQAPQHRQLTRMRHRVGEGPLQHAFRRHRLEKRCAGSDVLSQVVNDLVETLDLGL